LISLQSSDWGNGRNRRRGEREKKDYPPLNVKYRFHSTNDIIRAAEQGHPKRPVLSLPKESIRMPDKIMMTFHPQRWHDKPWPWVKELVWQNVKNQVKWMLLRLRD